MKIDVHNHVIPEPAIELLRTDPAYRSKVEGDHIRGGNHGRFRLEASFRDPDAKLKELESKGLEGAVLSAAPPLFFYELEAAKGEAMARATNRGLREFAAAEPTRYRWMAHVPMAYPETATRMLEEAVAEGAVGVEVGTSIAGRRLDEPAYDAFLAAVERLGVPLLIHPAYNEPNRALDDFYMQNAIGNLLETTIAVERLICAGALDRHPGLRVVLVHAGGFYPFQAGRLRHARSVRPELSSAPEDPFRYRGQVVADTITHDAGALRYLIDCMGAENVVMGTDLPFDMATPEPVAMLVAVAGKQVAQTVAEDNPARLYKFGD
ncbi:MAG: amidohydrolase family protein [Candidatus Dormibacterales bacterium]